MHGLVFDNGLGVKNENVLNYYLLHVIKLFVSAAAKRPIRVVSHSQISYKLENSVILSLGVT